MFDPLTGMTTNIGNLSICPDIVFFAVRIPPLFIDRRQERKRRQSMKKYFKTGLLYKRNDSLWLFRDKNFHNMSSWYMAIFIWVFLGKEHGITETMKKERKNLQACRFPCICSNQEFRLFDNLYQKSHHTRKPSLQRKMFHKSTDWLQFH